VTAARDVAREAADEIVDAVLDSGMMRCVPAWTRSVIAAAIERHGEAVRWMCAEACEEIKRTINEWDAMGDPAGEFQQWLKSKLCDEIANAIRALDLSEIGGGA